MNKWIKVRNFKQHDMQLLYTASKRYIEGDLIIWSLSYTIGLDPIPKGVPTEHLRTIIHDSLLESLGIFVMDGQEVSQYTHKRFKILFEKKINEKIPNKKLFDKVCEILENDEKEGD